jgi:hypothetical protein
MQPEINPVEINQIKPVHEVTNLSKYFAMTLFIILPFIGGWIGYNYAPPKILVNEIVIDKAVGEENILSDTSGLEKTASTSEKYYLEEFGCDYVVTNVHQPEMKYPCYRLEKYDESSKELTIISENLTDLYRETHPNLILKEFYRPELDNAIYFTAYTQDRMRSYEFVKFTFATMQFEDLDYGPSEYGDKASPDHKYIAKWIDIPNGELPKIQVIQTENGELVREIKPGPHETLASVANISIDGSFYGRFEWLGNRFLEYDVYQESYEEDSFLETRTVKLP